MIAHKTVSRWVDIFERLYMIFRLPPFGAPAIRAVKKEQKHYFLDWNAVADEGARFENLLAVHLLKVVFRAQDELGLDWELRYFRDRDSREVDFVLCDRRRPLLAVEAKLQDRPLVQPLLYLRGKFPGLRAMQVAFDGKRHTVSREGVESMPMLAFARLDLLAELGRNGPA